MAMLNNQMVYWMAKNSGPNHSDSGYVMLSAPHSELLTER